MEVIGFNAFLVWLVAGGSAMAASWLLERIAKFQELASDKKKFISYTVSALIGVGAYALVTFAPEFVDKAEPFFRILAVAFSSIFLANGFHRLDKKQ